MKAHARPWLLSAPCFVPVLLQFARVSSFPPVLCLVRFPFWFRRFGYSVPLQVAQIRSRSGCLWLRSGSRVGCGGLVPCVGCSPGRCLVARLWLRCGSVVPVVIQVLMLARRGNGQ